MTRTARTNGANDSVGERDLQADEDGDSRWPLPPKSASPAEESERVRLRPVRGPPDRLGPAPRRLAAGAGRKATLQWARIAERRSPCAALIARPTPPSKGQQAAGRAGTPTSTGERGAGAPRRARRRVRRPPRGKEYQHDYSVRYVKIMASIGHCNQHLSRVTHARATPDARPAKERRQARRRPSRPALRSRRGDSMAKSRSRGFVRAMAWLRCLAVPPGTGASWRCAGNGAAAGAVRVSDGELGPRAGSRQRPAVPDPGLEHVLRDSEL